jgi:hypothetical protein
MSKRKRGKKKKEDGDDVLYKRIPNHHNIHASLWDYLKGPFCSQVRFNSSARKYALERAGASMLFAGLLSQLKWHFYPHYRENRSRRKRGTHVKGSNSAQGKRVDAQICSIVALGGKRPSGKRKLNRLTVALLNYWADNGHQLQAGQIPAEVSPWDRITQADVITMHTRTGRLWMWEVKTGAPVGFYRKQGKFKAPLNDVDCTKRNIWELQRHYTVQALIDAGVHISESRVIQVHEDRRNAGGEPVVKVHKPPIWTRTIPKIKSKSKIVSAATYNPVDYGADSSEAEVEKKKKKKKPPAKLPRLSNRRFPTGMEGT